MYIKYIKGYLGVYTLKKFAFYIIFNLYLRGMIIAVNINLD